jgi:hypothetical protein
MPQEQRNIPITEWKEDQFTPSLPVRLPKAQLTKTGAKFGERMTFEQWLEIGVELAAMADSCQWWIGDWLLHGKAKFGDEKYIRAAALSGFTDRPLGELQFVAESIPAENRRDNLSWSIHAEVASLPKAQQLTFLDLAEREGYAVADLRVAMSPDKSPKPFSIVKWIGRGFESMKAMATTPSRRQELKMVLKPIVEFYQTL